MKDSISHFNNLYGSFFIEFMNYRMTLGKLVMGRVMHIVYRKPRDPEERERVPPIRDERTGQWKCQYCYKPDFNNTNEVIFV